MTRLAGAHALVTGGSSGIGLATAQLLASRGASVTVLARDQGRLDAAVATLEHGAGKVAADVTDRDRVVDAIAEAVAARGPIDIAVTSAGASRPGYFTTLGDDVFRGQMELDYFGTLNVVRALTPSMIERGHGHIVTIASTAALVGVFGFSAYAPAKYAVRGLAETLRPELAPHGIVVACAYPPDTDTPGLAAENLDKPAETAAISAAIAPRQAADVAAAIVRGIERDRLVIIADVQTAALARAAGLLSPYVRWTMDRTVRKARASKGTFGP